MFLLVNNIFNISRGINHSVIDKYMYIFCFIFFNYDKNFYSLNTWITVNLLFYIIISFIIIREWCSVWKRGGDVTVHYFK